MNTDQRRSASGRHFIRRMCEARGHWSRPHRWVRLSLIGLLGLAGCTRGGAVDVRLGVVDAWAGPALREFSARDDVRIESLRASAERDAPPADVLWERDLGVVLQAAARGELAPIDGGTPERIAAMVGAERLWVGLSGIVRVLVYDPERIAEEAAPTRLAELARPELARQLVLADPTRGSGLWTAAALMQALGTPRGREIYHGLLRGGARVVDDEDAVLAALAAGSAPLALTDSDVAFAAQERLPRLIIIVPDQDPRGLGALLLPIAVALTRRGAENAAACRLIAYLLSTPVTLRLTLTGNQVLTLRGTNAPPGMLRAEDLHLMAVSLGPLLDRLPAVRAALGNLGPPV